MPRFSESPSLTHCYGLTVLLFYEQISWVKAQGRTSASCITSEKMGATNKVHSGYVCMYTSYLDIIWSYCVGMSMYLHTYIHLALLNSSIEAGILLCGNGALPRHDGRALSRACVTRLSALSFGCFSYTGSHSLLLLT